MAAGKHTKGRHSASRVGRREIEFPRGPQDPSVSDDVGVPEEIAKTAAGKMQTAVSSHDERPTGEAATGERLDDWVEEQAASPDDAARAISRRGVIGVVAVVVAAVLAIALIAFIASYQPLSTPTQVTERALDDVKDGDYEALAGLYAGDATVLEGTLENAFAAGADLGSYDELSSRLNDEQRRTLAELQDKVTDFDFTCGVEEVEGDRARVAVTLTTYDLGTFAQRVLGDYIADGLEAASRDDLESDADAATRFIGVVREQQASLGSKNRQTQAVFELKRSDDGSWKLSELSADDLDALSGGLVSTASSMAAQLESGSQS